MSRTSTIPETTSRQSRASRMPRVVHALSLLVELQRKRLRLQHRPGHYLLARADHRAALDRHRPHLAEPAGKGERIRCLPRFVARALVPLVST